MATPPPLGEFEVTVLMAVMHLGDSAFGTSVLHAIQQRTGRKVARGAVYVTLDRLVDKGLLTGRVDAASPERGGHPRRYFRVTAAGTRSVRHAVTMMARMQAGLEPLLGKL